MKLLQKAKALRNRSFETLGLSYLSLDFMRFLKMHSFYNVAVNLSGVFVSTFLLKAGSGFGVVGLYYFTAFMVEAVGNGLMPRFGTKFSQAAMSRVGMLLYLGSYLLLLGFRESVLGFYPLIAVMNAMGASLYWFPFHYYTINYTNPRNRQYGMSLLGMVGNMIVLITPLLSGILIGRLEANHGYILIFSLSAVSFAIAIWQSRKLPSAPSDRPRNALWRFLREEYAKPLVRNVSFAHVCYGLRDGVYMYFVNILIFETMQNGGEMALGLNITLRSILIIAAFALMARFLTLKRRIRLNFIVLSASLCFSLVLMGWTVPAVLLTACVLDAVTQAFTHNSLQLATYELADYMGAHTGHHRDLAIAMRNVSLNGGRAVGVIALVLISAHLDAVAVWPLVMLNALALPTAFFLRRVIQKSDG